MEKRIIKFRALNFDGDWRYGYLVVGDGDAGRPHYILNNGVNGVRSRVRPETVGQFIGEWDRKKTAIYEGDIVERYGYGENGDYLEIAGQSCHEVSLDSLGLWLKDEATDWEFESFTPDTCEVIGNIWEHPLLLTPTTTTEAR